MNLNQIYNAECLTWLQSLPDKSINCCVTSPPYYGLRDYGNEAQIGLEKTPEEYIEKLVNVFHEVYRVLKNDGTLWVNIGDSYAGSMKGAARFPDNAMNYKQGTNRGTLGKPNPMPESVTDRCTKSHEYIFLLSKSKKYYFDSKSIQQTASQSVKSRLGKVENVGYKAFATANNLEESNPMFRKSTTREYQYADKANKRSVWHIPTSSYKDAHFAVFPENLIVDCIKAGCPEDGIVIDPFMGSGTTAVVARKLNRYYVGAELNPNYIDIAKKRLSKELGFFK